MPQFRLTAKMANMLNVSHLPDPAQNPNVFFDDWYVAITNIIEKEVIICHACCDTNSNSGAGI